MSEVWVAEEIFQAWSKEMDSKSYRVPEKQTRLLNISQKNVVLMVKRILMESFHMFDDDQAKS